MNIKLNLAEKLDFTDIDLTPPDEVIKKVIDQIEDETNGIVLGKIVNYNGAVMSYRKPGLSSISIALSGEGRDVDIQEDLGKVGEESHKYECYLYASNYEKYKYRVFFIKYDVANYPVNVILEESVSKSISTKNASYIYTCNNREELEELITRIFTSKKIISVMQELIRIYQSKKLEAPIDELDVEVEE